MEPACFVEPGGDYRATSFADMADSLDANRFHDPDYSPVLRAMVSRVIEQEAPIRDHLLIDRVARAHGIKRSGRLIRERVLSIARGSAHVQAEDDSGAFVWPDAEAARTWATVRLPATNGDIRPIEDIALPELTAALRACVSDEPEVEAARRLGVRRLSASARSRLARAAMSEGHFLR